MPTLESFVRAVAVPPFKERGWVRDKLRFRRPFGDGDAAVAEFRAYPSGRAPLEFHVDLGVVVAPHLEFVHRGRPVRGTPSTSHGLWQGRLTPPGQTPGGAWALDPEDAEAVAAFVAALEARLDELGGIANRDVLLRLARERAALVDKSRSGILLPTPAVEALLLLGTGDMAGARAAAEELLGTDPDSPVAEWVLGKVR
ncbi:hypothetical protein ASD81_23145 [Nocardioides sp. Root614]|nr:hypothetical protein ASD81_23145 [Nocardioides sp. Root614]KRA86041.1 hypothetical protein ASD84_23385 [Nocardioides sp. Root682]